jgi:hypothetical protein
MVHHWPDTLAPPAVPDCGVDACWHAPPYLRIGICSDQTAQIKWNMTRKNGYVYVNRVTAKRNWDNERWIGDGIIWHPNISLHWPSLRRTTCSIYIYIQQYTCLSRWHVQDTNYALCKPGQAMSWHKFHHVPSPSGAYWGNRREGVKVKEKNLTVHSAASQKSWGMLSSEW